MSVVVAAGVGIGLRQAVNRSQRRHLVTMLALMAPSVLFVAAMFVTPIALSASWPRSSPT